MRHTPAHTLRNGQRIYRFGNGLGASLIPQSGWWELGVVAFSGPSSRLFRLIAPAALVGHLEHGHTLSLRSPQDQRLDEVLDVVAALPADVDESGALGLAAEFEEEFERDYRRFYGLEPAAALPGEFDAELDAALSTWRAERRGG